MRIYAFFVWMIFAAAITASAHGQGGGDIIPDSPDIVKDGVSGADNAIPNPSDIINDADAADAEGITPRQPYIPAYAGDGGGAPKRAADTGLPPLTGRFYGIGIGVSLGAIPLFDMWSRALPDSLSRLGLAPDFGRIPEIGDTMPLRLDIAEAFEAFNFFVPFGISFCSIKEKSAAALALQFFYNSKQFQSTLYPYLGADDRRVDVFETLVFYSLTLEASYSIAIPPEYFKIDGVSRAFLSLTAGVSPLQYFSRSGDISVHAPKSDARMRAAADSAGKSMSAGFAANGAAISWRAGISAAKALQSGSGLEFGLYYGGAYSGWFYSGGERVMKSEIHIEEEEVDKPLSFISSRIEFKATYLKKIKNTNLGK